jgi:hypothetical protein
MGPAHCLYSREFAITFHSRIRYDHRDDHHTNAFTIFLSPLISFVDDRHETTANLLASRRRRVVHTAHTRVTSDPAGMHC